LPDTQSVAACPWRSYPLITEAALRNRNNSFVLDGEAVLLGIDGISDFNGLHSRKHDDEVMFYAFDILVSEGEDLRQLPLHLRKTNLARLLARRINGIFLADFERGPDRSRPIRHACLMGLEGLVSKHKDRPYRPGRSPHWVKVKNRKHPAMSRVMDPFHDLARPLPPSAARICRTSGQNAGNTPLLHPPP
jgi:bifunctional non-homologous end joining protein LigD